MAVKIVRDEPLFKKAALNEIRVLKKCDGICPQHTHLPALSLLCNMYVLSAIACFSLLLLALSKVLCFSLAQRCTCSMVMLSTQQPCLRIIVSPLALIVLSSACSCHFSGSLAGHCGLLRLCRDFTHLKHVCVAVDLYGESL